MISAICGRNEKGDVIKNYGKIEVLLYFQKRFVWGVTLSQELKELSLPTAFRKRGMPRSVNSWYMRN